MKFIQYIFGLLLLGLLSCTADNKTPSAPAAPNPAQQQKDQAIIADYIKKNHLQMKSTPSGLHYKLDHPGGEINLNAYGSDARIVAHYHGTFLDGKVFDSSVEKGKPFAFELGSVIPGWRESIRMMGVGGRGKFIVPSHLAYGAGGVPGRIEPHTILVFDIELLAIGGG